MKPFEQYLRFLLDLLSARKLENEEEEDKILDQIDGPWYKLSTKEIESIEQIHSALHGKFERK